MAEHTPWAGEQADKLYLQSGEFTSTLKTSQYVGGIDFFIYGISWDGQNTPWIGDQSNKLYLQSGQFTSTLKTSESVAIIDGTPFGISWDGQNTPWAGLAADKLYLQSGQFTSTLKTSKSTGGQNTDVSSDGTDTPWSGGTPDRLYLQSGQFTSTIKTSQDVSGVDNAPQGISWNGTDTPWIGSGADKLYLQSGQFTATIKTSEYIGGIDLVPIGVCTTNVVSRLGLGPQVHTETAESTVTFVQEAASEGGTGVVEGDTPWCGEFADKLYLQSGEFTSTLKTSEHVGGIDTLVWGISWDGTNTPWIGDAANKLYLQSGQFTSTLKTSESIGAIDTLPFGISWDGQDTPWAGLNGDRLYLQSGQFTSTLKTSLYVNTINGTVTDVSSDSTDTPWSGASPAKLYFQSGQFTSTIKTSQDVSGVDTAAQGVSWNGISTPWVGSTDDKLYLQSGQFTSTLKTSEYIGGIDSIPTGVCTTSVTSRLGPQTHTETAESTVTFGQEALRGAIQEEIAENTVTFTQTAAPLIIQSNYPVTSTVTFSQTATVIQMPMYLTTSNAIAFTQEARIPDTLSAEALNTVIFSQLIVRAGTEPIAASSPLNFLVEADATLNGTTIYSRAVTHALDFTQEATQGVPFKVARAESSLEFTQSILAIFPRSVVASSLLEFLQGIRYSPISVFAESDLAEIIWTVPEDSNVTLEPTGFQQTVGLTQIAGQAPPDSRINFEQNARVVHIRAADGISKVAENTITFTQEAQVTHGGGSVVTFTQTAIADLCKPTKSVVTFTQVVDLESITTRTASNTVEFRQSAYHTLTRVGELCNAQGRVVPELPHYDNVQFAYPLTSVTHTLTLRGAEFGNRERMHFQRINRETRGGTLIVFADPIWPKNDHLVMDFVGLTETETNQVRSFIKTTLGKQVTLRDWEGRNWVGVIVSPNNPVVRDGALCMNTVTIELEGHAGYDTTASSTVTFTQTAEGTKT
jgi:hypothetical protein